MVGTIHETKPAQANEIDMNETPIYWFIVLERSVDIGDMEAAGKASANLRRLGVEVKYRPNARRAAGVAHA